VGFLKRYLPTKNSDAIEMLMRFNVDISGKENWKRSWREEKRAQLSLRPLRKFIEGGWEL
jgi:hypothetical protein